MKEPGESHVLGFIPSGWYPSALLLTPKMKLYVGNSKGLEPHSNVMGPTSPLLNGKTSTESIRDIQRGTVNIVSLMTSESASIVDETGLRQHPIQRRLPDHGSAAEGTEHRATASRRRFAD